MSILYNISIYLYLFLIRLVALFNPKAKLWLQGREDIFKKIAKNIRQGDRIAWFHCASLGEFEQGRTLIEKFKKQNSEYKILLTFFSPSGYEIRKDWETADYILYLPIDTPKNATRFIELTRPEIVFFVKYEYWYNYIRTLNKQKIPIFIVSAIFRPEQHFFKWYGLWFRNQLKRVSWFFVQNEVSQKLLNTIGISRCSISGDTRFDRVLEIANIKNPFPLIEKFSAGKNVVVAGSTWPQDEVLILDLINSQEDNFKFIIAPHEINPDRIRGFINKCNRKAIRYSEAKEESVNTVDVLIIDSIGILSFLYRYAKFAYIGGGFGKGIHNILEAVTYGLPVIFGPGYTTFQEANDLVKLQGAFSIKNREDLFGIFDKLQNDELFYQNGVSVCTQYIQEKAGATAIILSKISNQTKK